ncbi:hypothetical protein [Spiroplasma sp. AdecLV25b]|uniref:hypothetical protein n=1 Tax=Spiroplasma sp. AdecLV25b TaxID=3027162 RepID=UPI0027E140E4|nr:hypothetical protein [Spiroplasma sp. AdecLV25b]
MKKILWILLALVFSTSSIGTAASCCVCCSSILNSILKVKDLSNLYIGLNAIPKENTIKRAIKANNKDIDINAIKVTDITNSGAKVSSNGRKYTGDDVNVNFTVTHFKVITNITTKIESLTIGINGTIYAGSNDGKLYKINKGTDAITDITSTIPDIIRKLTTGIDGTIYAGSNDGKLYKINKDTDTVTETETEWDKIKFQIF